MPDACHYSAIICNLWIDEAKGMRCKLEKGHDGPCRSERDEDG